MARSRRRSLSTRSRPGYAAVLPQTIQAKGGLRIQLSASPSGQRVVDVDRKAARLAGAKP